MYKRLLSSKPFSPLFWCQFFSAFNDNLLKNGLVALIVYVLARKDGAALVQLAGAVFILPSFLLSGLGGQLADRFDKALIARRLKFAEVFGALFSAAGFYFHSVPLLMVSLGVFGAISALFGPVKYGILPDQLAPEELPGGNALVEAATFLAILLGSILGTKVVAAGYSRLPFSGLIVGLSIACWLSARAIPATREAAPDLKVERNIFASTKELLGILRASKKLWWSGIAISWFWLVGAVTLPLLSTLVKNCFSGTDSLYVFALTLFSVGIALGSLVAAWMAHGRIILLPTVVASILMGCFGIDLGLAASAPCSGAWGITECLRSTHGLRFTLDLLGFSACGGLFIVPVFAALQTWAGVECRARAIAAVNVLSAAFMVAGALGTALLQKLDATEPQILIGLGVANIGLAFLICSRLEVNVVADFLSVLYRAIFRMEIHGQENVAKAGANAIFALNHVSFLDAGLALSLTDRRPVFAIDHSISKRWWVRPWLALVNAMPLDPTKPIATRALINAVRAGRSLVIFPEGRLTVTGSLMKVYDGAGLIADKSGVFILPVRIDGLHNTPFTRLSPQQVRRRWFPKVVVTICEPVKLNLPEQLKGKPRRIAAGAALYDVMADLIYHTTPADRTIMEAVVSAALEQGPGRIALEDPLAGPVSYRKLLAAACVLGRKILPLAPEGKPVGILLPTANVAAVAILGTMSAGRVPAMLNFSAGPENIKSACRSALVEVVLTSRSFVEAARLGKIVSAIGEVARVVYLEDLKAEISSRDRLAGVLRWKRPLVARRCEEPAVILFTSGSEGTPKGVVLSHKNLLSNIAQVLARVDFTRTDLAFNVLPLFHSFGLTGGLLLPLVAGMRVFLYPSPLHYRIVPELVYGKNATLLFGTDTFLAGYARNASPYDFRSVRYVLAGAEPVKNATREVWMEKFGIRILEGYGVTETAPALAFNTPMANRFGTVGRLLPGVEARLEPVPGIESGARLFVKGPNVMLGYLRAENPGVIDPPPEGWHDTGDIVAIDPAGFVTIQGRAKRFAKLGGEMVSLTAVEALASKVWAGFAFAAVAQPDSRKGERVVLVTDYPGATRQALSEAMRSAGAAELTIPAQVEVVERVPLLGSGKTDYPAVARLVGERGKEKAVSPSCSRALEDQEYQRKPSLAV
jgi:acyl-[acyl-carrier-protein]-phospholipid O-acyltransferase/long-chain-fatty-acid--[acyl-carrier-protein] ligase